MNKRKYNLATLIGLFFIIAASQGLATEKLSEVLRKTKWDKIIGTWVDRETSGKVFKTIYAWKIKDRVVEVTTVVGNLKEVALIGVNGKTGEVFCMAARSDGTSMLGKFDFEENGDAVLGVAYTTGDGTEGGVKVRHHLHSKDSMKITLELAQPIHFNLIRSK